MILVKFGDEAQYTSRGFGRLLDNNETKTIRLMKQESKGLATKALSSFAKGMKAVLEVLAGGGPIAQLLLRFGSINMWPLIEGM
jgi:hypothetical protein